MIAAMDRTDLKILAILQEDSSLPVAEVAARLKVITQLQQGRNAVRRAILEPLNLLTDLVFGGVPSIKRRRRLHRRAPGR